MKVTASEIEGSQVVLEMEIEAERVEKAMEKAYRRIVSRVNVPGFRRGKAPRVMVERLVGRETLMNEALEILIPEAYDEAVRETGIDPVGQPELDIVGAEPLSVKATVPVRPKVELGDYKAIRQTLETPEVTEEQVDNTLESLRQSRAEWVPMEREARAGDLVTIDIRGRADDETFIDSQNLHVVLDPERQIIAPGVVEQIIGMKPEDRKALDVTLPDDFAKKELAGKEATLEIGINEVKEKQVPELDDELAKSLGDYSSVDELRASVREQLQKQSEAEARHNLEESVVAAVVDQAKAEPPEVWVEEQAKALVESTKSRVGLEGLSFEQFLRFSDRTEKAFEEEMESTARRQLKRSLVLDSVAKEEGIEVTDEEVETAVEKALSEYQGKVTAEERERIKSNYRPRLRERKTVDRLVEIATGGQDAAEATRGESPPVEENQTGEEE
ncbi:MAG: trigger factor [Chloroflexota bacterium]